MGNLKRNSSIIFILFMISLFIGCAKQAASYEPTIKDIALKTNSTDLEAISKQVMVKAFDEYKKNSVTKELRIEDYTINKINDIQGNIERFSFSIDYSLKPSYINSYVLAGNGAVKDSWVINKFAFVEVQKIDKEYKINSMGTGK